MRDAGGTWGLHTKNRFRGFDVEVLERRAWKASHYREPKRGSVAPGSMNSVRTWMGACANLLIDAKDAVQHRVLQHDFMRFVFAGVFNTGLSFSVYCGGIYLGLPYYTSNAIAWIVGVTVA